MLADTSQRQLQLVQIGNGCPINAVAYRQGELLGGLLTEMLGWSS